MCNRESRITLQKAVEHLLVSLKPNNIRVHCYYNDLISQSGFVDKCMSYPLPMSTVLTNSKERFYTHFILILMLKVTPENRSKTFPN